MDVPAHVYFTQIINVQSAMRTMITFRICLTELPRDCCGSNLDDCLRTGPLSIEKLPRHRVWAHCPKTCESDK